MCSTVTNLTFIYGVIMDAVPLTNITYPVSVTNLCKFYKYAGIVNYSSVFNQLGFVLLYCPLHLLIWSKNIFSLVVYFIVIG